MQNTSLMHPAYSSRRIISISIGILSTLLLASCGGGGSSDPNATAQSADDATKTIQAVSGSTAVPGTWTGRAPKMEVINGITVPPEPAPAINNATLAGVDVNNNGVRDDVERGVAKQASTIGEFNNSLPLVRAYQTVLSTPTPVRREEGLLQEKMLLCNATDYKMVPATLRPTSDNSIEAQVFNTDIRKAKLNALRAIVGGYDSSEVKCD